MFCSLLLEVNAVFDTLDIDMLQHRVGTSGAKVFL